ncbi:hypothetical protein Hanom_Chr13g01192921 [Helianthus anomalus]
MISKLKSRLYGQHIASRVIYRQLICCPIGSPNTEVGLGRANLNFATLWLSCVRFTSLNSLKFSGSMHPNENNPSYN